ncbi:MAG: hypothetical protein Q8R00_03955 [Candidatus Nanoarchaeia archaeon]|nr:hypothetical protein [Candidatus Nanoarchaeia archaeon]
MDKETYLIFHNVDGSVSHLKNLLNMEANKYYCLGNLVKKEIKFGSDLEESFECLDIFRRKNNGILFTGEAERNLVNMIYDKESQHKSLINTLIEKPDIEHLQKGRTVSCIKAIGTYFMPKAPNNSFKAEDWDENWSNHDEILKESRKNQKIEACDLERAELYDSYEEIILSLMDYLVWPQERDYPRYSFFFMGNRYENAMWKKVSGDLKLFSTSTNQPEIMKIMLNQKEGPHIITPGSAKHGLFCRFTIPDMKLELFSEPDFRETREIKKIGFKKKLP